MEATGQNSGYWFVLQDQGNVFLSSNNTIHATIQAPQAVQALPQIKNKNELKTGIAVAAVPETRYINTEVAAAPARPYIQEEQSDGEEKRRKRKGKEEDSFWDRDKVKMLLTMCLENRTMPKETLWQEISALLHVTPEECNNKYRHLRRTYLRLLKKKRLGKHIKWIHYNTCEEVFTDLRALPSSVLEPWDDNKVRRLLTLYIENLPRFRSPGFLQKDIWKDIAQQLGSTGYNCYHKFKNLRRTYWNGLNRSRETGKLTKWAYHHYFERIYYNYKPCSKSWDRHKIKVLLDSYAQIAHKFRNPKMQKRELWKEIAAKVGESPHACDKKFRNLKQTYVRLKSRADSGRLSTKWRYFRDFESIYSNLTRYIDIDGTQKIVYRPVQDDNYKKELLTFYLQNKHKFRDPLIKNRTLWKQIAPRLGMTADECDKQFRNLKQTYIRLAWKKKQTGKCNKWPYFDLFEEIFEESSLFVAEAPVKADVDDIVRTEIRRVVEDVHERRESDRKFERLMQAAEESNDIQRERNRILLALLNRR